MPEGGPGGLGGPEERPDWKAADSEHSRDQAEAARDSLEGRLGSEAWQPDEHELEAQRLAHEQQPPPGKQPPEAADQARGWLEGVDRRNAVRDALIEQAVWQAKFEAAQREGAAPPPRPRPPDDIRSQVYNLHNVINASTRRTHGPGAPVSPPLAPAPNRLQQFVDRVGERFETVLHPIEALRQRRERKEAREDQAMDEMTSNLYPAGVRGPMPEPPEHELDQAAHYSRTVGERVDDWAVGVEERRDFYPPYVEPVEAENMPRPPEQDLVASQPPSERRAAEAAGERRREVRDAAINMALTDIRNQRQLPQPEVTQSPEAVARARQILHQVNHPNTRETRESSPPEGRPSAAGRVAREVLHPVESYRDRRAGRRAVATETQARNPDLGVTVHEPRPEWQPDPNSQTFYPDGRLRSEQSTPDNAPPEPRGRVEEWVDRKVIPREWHERQHREAIPPDEHRQEAEIARIHRTLEQLHHDHHDTLAVDIRRELPPADWRAICETLYAEFGITEETAPAFVRDRARHMRAAPKPDKYPAHGRGPLRRFQDTINRSAPRTMEGVPYEEFIYPTNDSHVVIIERREQGFEGDEVTAVDFVYVAGEQGAFDERGRPTDQLKSYLDRPNMYIRPMNASFRPVATHEDRARVNAERRQELGGVSENPDLDHELTNAALGVTEHGEPVGARNRAADARWEQEQFERAQRRDVLGESVDDQRVAALLLGGEAVDAKSRVEAWKALGDEGPELQRTLREALVRYGEPVVTGLAEQVRGAVTRNAQALGIAAGSGAADVLPLIELARLERVHTQALRRGDRTVPPSPFNARGANAPAASQAIDGAIDRMIAGQFVSAIGENESGAQTDRLAGMEPYARQALEEMVHQLPDTARNAQGNLTPDALQQIGNRLFDYHRTYGPQHWRDGPLQMMDNEFTAELEGIAQEPSEELAGQLEALLSRAESRGFIVRNPKTGKYEGIDEHSRAFLVRLAPWQEAARLTPVTVEPELASEPAEALPPVDLQASSGDIHRTAEDAAAERLVRGRDGVWRPLRNVMVDPDRYMQRKLEPSESERKTKEGGKEAKAKKTKTADKSDGGEQAQRGGKAAKPETKQSADVPKLAREYNDQLSRLVKQPNRGRRASEYSRMLNQAIADGFVEKAPEEGLGVRPISEESGRWLNRIRERSDRFAAPPNPAAPQSEAGASAAAEKPAETSEGAAAAGSEIASLAAALAAAKEVQPGVPDVGELAPRYDQRLDRILREPNRDKRRMGLSRMLTDAIREGFVERAPSEGLGVRPVSEESGHFLDRIRRSDRFASSNPAASRVGEAEARTAAESGRQGNSAPEATAPAAPEAPSAGSEQAAPSAEAATTEERLADLDAKYADELQEVLGEPDFVRRRSQLGKMLSEAIQEGFLEEDPSAEWGVRPISDESREFLDSMSEYSDWLNNPPTA